MTPRPDRRRIALAVTSDASIAFVAGLAEYLDGRGWDVHVVSSGGQNADDLARRGRVSLHTVAMRREPSPLADLVSVVRAVRLLRRLRPDVVSVATPKAALVVGIAAWLSRVPVRVHQLWGLRYETTSGVRRRLLRALEQVSAAVATDVVAVSPSLRDVALAEGVATQIAVVGPGTSHGVDVERFAPDASSRRAARFERWGSADVPVVGFVGRLHPDKGLDTLVDAVRLADGRGVRGHLLLVGGEEGAGHLLDGLADLTSWTHEVTGHVADVAPWLRLMDVLCLPSRREGFPNVVLEAAAAGVPCIGTPATGVVDAIVDGSTGLVTPDHSAQSLAAAVERLVADPGLREDLGERARRRVAERFDQRLVWEAYAGHYARLVGDEG